MALYLIGDVQGCDGALARLLDLIDFSPSRDRLVLLGDLVNRGPQSGAVLRRLVNYGDAACALLGNHDLHLLALAWGVRPPHRSDTVAELLQAPDAPALLDWLRHRPLAWQEAGVLMVHAGVLPPWRASDVLTLAAEVHSVLRSPAVGEFLHHMYGNQPDQWRPGLRGVARLRVIVNALTRLRYCTADGRMEFDSKEGTGHAPSGYMPWFDVPGRLTAGDVVAFGHWSTLGWVDRPDILSLDTGCVWGGFLSAVRLGPTPQDRTLIQVPCPQAQRPGTHSA
ncbi:symmetrical bis(5'-nucleosyl)-tetraphosphatase [Comamonadaceae bacterium OH2545_COT-014]|nr:symmetrical bis(5'-nucleosyl)-tetraphosphatase [Comamonadaceae bacterium OH2545_COT-014]